MSTENPYISLTEFAEDALDVKLTDFQKLYLGDWSAQQPLYELATDCCRDYDRRCELSEDELNPSRSKPGFPTFTQIAREEIHAHYDEARSLGFDGDEWAWARMVYNTRPPEREKLYLREYKGRR